MMPTLAGADSSAPTSGTMQKNPDRKKMIQNGFDTVAAGYDHPSLAFFPETAKRLVAHLDLEPHQHLLDVCTGTGAVALTAAEKLTAGKVFGIDLSAGMLQQAKNKAAAKKLDNTEFRQMDLDELEFPDATFDVTTSSFGIFFLEDMTKALGHIAGTVKPGGKIAITSFAGDAFSPFADLFINQYEATGREVPPLSWKRLATVELIKEQFHAIGITKLEIHHELLGYHMTDPQMWWDVVWNAGWRSLLNQLSADEQAEFEHRHKAAVSAALGDEGTWFNTEVLIAIGER
jgi:ubiquinone/menaquinone biosynthesis C-methylase UbiE